MTEWRHIIPVTKYFPESGDVATRDELLPCCKAIAESLQYNRAFLVYAELDEEALRRYDEIADEFYTEGSRSTYVPEVAEFDDIMQALYDWADSNQIWID